MYIELKDYFTINFIKFINSFYNTNISKYYHYVLKSHSKKIRALSCLLILKEMDLDLSLGLRSAFAIEMIHTYSLIHDDLPVMDNDNWRRNQPSAHKMFSESDAILIGDGLLADAFYVLNDDKIFPKLKNENIIKSTKILSKACGSKGMVYGQKLDMDFTAKDTVEITDINNIHLYKTGKMMGAAFALGALAANLPQDDIDKLQLAGEYFGIAYQINDDITDNLKFNGKTPGKDIKQDKSSYLKIFEKKETQKYLNYYIDKSQKILENRFQKSINFMKAVLNVQ